MIERIGVHNLMNNLDAGLDARAASFCGFDQWTQVAADLSSDGRALVATRAQLRQLSELAMEVSADIRAYAELTWSKPERMEIYDPSIPHSTEEWVALHYPPDAKQNLYTFTGTTRAGDRVFQMHFFSRDYPTLEGKLATLERLKTEYWEARRAAH
ncbi:MAG: hypothetical protein R3F49_17200 [Planctomycetota bacterium]